MRRLRSVMLAASVAAVFLGVSISIAQSNAEPGEPVSTEAVRVQVTLSAGLTTVSWDASAPEPSPFELPLLVLHQERVLAVESDRTLEISIAGLPAGSVIKVTATSWHRDVTTGLRRTIARTFVLPNQPCTTDVPCIIRWTFDPQIALTDLYTLRLWDSEGKLLWENPDEDRPDFVMLDTWDTKLDGYTVRIWYATLFTFARGQNDLDSRLSPSAIVDYIERHFVPTIRDTWHTQFHTWGFGKPIHPDWDTDKVVEIIITDAPFALFDGSGTYTQFSGQDGVHTGQARIWWLASNNSFQAYESLEAGTRAVFAHEFFHLVQVNVLLATPHPNARWINVFIEAQGKLAPSVQYAEMELGRHDVGPGRESEYTETANRYLQHRLNASYQELESDPVHRYDAILYWRFLYEQFGDIRIIRRALSEMTHRQSDDIVSSMPAVMDRVFNAVASPFGSFEESLAAFAAANYSLRLRSSACKAGDATQCDGTSYQYAAAYRDPPLEAELRYGGAPLTYQGAIPSSFGMDFLEIRVDPAVQDQPLTVSVRAEGSTAHFSVQVWRIAFPWQDADIGSCGTNDTALLAMSGGGATWLKPYTLTPSPETVEGDAGVHTRTLFPSDTEAYSRLALIIVRLDPHETDDSIGAYRVTVEAD